MNYHYFLKETCLIGKFMKSNLNTNKIYANSFISRENWSVLNRHKSILLLLTGISGSGKTALAFALEKQLYFLDCRAVVLDGDIVRQGLCSDLKYTDNDRTENLRRVGEISKYFVDAGIIVLASFIAPTKVSRNLLKEKVGSNNFLEIYLNCPIEVCEERDVKGLYKKARAGGIPNFTGISSKYEKPLNSDLSIDSSKISINESVNRVVKLLTNIGVIYEN